MLDGNTVALNNYLYKQEQLELLFELSKEEKCHTIVQYARNILLGLVPDEEFVWALADLFDEDEVLTDEGSMALEDWDMGIDSILSRKLCLIALESASEILYDIELSEIAYWNNSDWTNIMVDELMDMGGWL